jgi:hypothetical protein
VIDRVPGRVVLHLDARPATLDGWIEEGQAPAVMALELAPELAQGFDHSLEQGHVGTLPPGFLR